MLRSQYTSCFDYKQGGFKLIATYNILIRFEEDKFISDYPEIKLNVDSLDEMDIYDHAEVCVNILNYYCNMFQQMGELIVFKCEDEDLTEQVKEILIKHK